MSLDTLQVNGLYVILFLRTSPHTPNNFHWGLYLHRSPQQGGTICSDDEGYDSG